MIVIIDYGLGNLGSIKNMLKKVGSDSVISSDLEQIGAATKLILPGVGAFDRGMQNLADRGMIDLLKDCVVKKQVPILGICLGMQLFSLSSEEGQLPGLGWIEAKTIRFDSTRMPTSEKSTSLKVPHMGWNEVHLSKASRLFDEEEEIPRFYFVHSYHVICEHPEDVLARTTYGEEFTSMIEHNNIIGVQCHPEKSHKFGMRVMRNFVERY